MKILWRYWKIHYSCGFQSRYLSARTIAEPETVFSRCLVCVSSCGTKVLDLQDFLQNCTMKMAINEGKICHGQTIQAGLQRDTLTSNILINMYSKCGFLDCARQVFDAMPERSLISWNTMIGSYTHHRKEDDALDLFMQMQREGIQPSEFTLSSLLCACAAKSALSDTKQLHAFSLKTGLYTNAFVGTAVLDVYAKCNLIMDAYQIFDKMPEKSSVTWSSMVAGFVQNDLYEEALMLFQRAQTHGLEQNQFILSAVLCACANLAAPIEGCQVHSVLVKTGFGSNLFVVSSLIDMYAKCGSIEEAYFVFSSAEKKNVVSWNTMISGFCRHACSIEAMILFEKMQQMGMCPNEITYVSVLSACSHKGLVEEGKRYFELMVGQCIYPGILHYSCMVDILSRVGKLCEALDLIERMPFEATASMWGSLLASCRIHGNLELAEIAAGRLFDIEPNNAGNHVLLSNIYAANKRWEEVSRARKLLKESGAKKEMGKSWIEVRHKLHTFVVGERNHPRIAEIYAKLDYLTEEVKKLGYKAETEHDLHDVEEVQKEEFLRHHSEKLALAFGLIDSPPGAPIRIKKNLRICWDCHSFIKLASQIIGMKIIVRDTNRFHHFGNGSCSCGDFW